MMTTKEVEYNSAKYQNLKGRHLLGGLGTTIGTYELQHYDFQSRGISKAFDTPLDREGVPFHLVVDPQSRCRCFVVSRRHFCVCDFLAEVG